MVWKQIVSDCQTSQCLNQFASCTIQPRAESVSAFLKSLSLFLQPPLFALTPFWTVSTHLYQVPTFHLSRKSLRAGSPSPPYTRASKSVSCTASCLSSCPGSHWERDHCLSNRESIQSLLSGLHHLPSWWVSEVWNTSSALWKLVRDAHCPGSVSPKAHPVLLQSGLGAVAEPFGDLSSGCQWPASLPFPIPYLFSFWYLAELLALKPNVSLDSQSSVHPSLSALEPAAANPDMAL